MCWKVDSNLILADLAFLVSKYYLHLQYVDCWSICFTVIAAKPTFMTYADGARCPRRWFTKRRPLTGYLLNTVLPILLGESWKNNCKFFDLLIGQVWRQFVDLIALRWGIDLNMLVWVEKLRKKACNEAKSHIFGRCLNSFWPKKSLFMSLHTTTKSFFSTE